MSTKTTIFLKIGYSAVVLLAIVLSLNTFGLTVFATDNKTDVQGQNLGKMKM